MQRINTPDGNFSAGDPSAGVKGTVLTRDWAQSMQEEVAHAVERSGQKLDSDDNEQLYKAIIALARGVVPTRVGEIVLEMRREARAGWLLLDGSELKRADYPQLWAYAQASGVLLSESKWQQARGHFSEGDGSRTFRIPDLRGEFLRCWADGSATDAGRSLGSWQDSSNRQHAHRASTGGAGAHVHKAWSAPSGKHAHQGKTAPVADHQHVSPWGENPGQYNPPWGTWGQSDQLGAHGNDRDNVWGLTSPSGKHDHPLSTDEAPDHLHSVGMNSAADHEHPVTIEPTGELEARPRNIAIAAFICARTA
ncbi:hypothetical protein [Caballeronia sp. LZ001]|uniref:phage tail protein n=1 Tax=Caballeronia sp. LZ001 TaxID=3038553 RepID=UPI0028584CD9|nr:hypothetical protein [Caballeronia sp. LZ001]MDR5803393.1 hypothetical protein [Caballeronia sp. LZ001]